MVYKLTTSPSASQTKKNKNKKNKYVANSLPKHIGLPVTDILSALLPNRLGRIYHLEIEGRNTIASFALTYVMDAQTEILGVRPELCAVEDEFRWLKCRRPAGQRAAQPAQR